MNNNLPTHYVNSFNMQNGPNEIFLTLGLTSPELKEMLPMFQCVMTGDCLAHLIDSLQVVYQAYVQQKASEEVMK